jgi:Putative Flp pilus-assembly TadE/G-like
MNWRTPILSDDRGDGPPAPRGQVLIMFALALTGLIGILGLATDLGVAFAQRRTMQNAADAGALAGARAVTKWEITTPAFAARPDVTAMVQQNTMGGETPEIERCVYIRYDGAGSTDCGSPVPSWATGVRVQVRENHSTFFMRILGIDDVTTKAEATAHVQLFTGVPADGPFIVCGSDAWAVEKADGTRLPGQGSSVPLVLTGDDDDDDDAGSARVNPAFVGWTFIIHSNKLSQGSESSPGYKAGCNTKPADGGADWNGLANGAANAGKEAPDWFHYESGTKAGPTRTEVSGAQGCEEGAAEPYNCIMFLPLAVNSPEPNDNKLWVVGYAAFYVWPKDTNEYYGKLIDEYLVSGPGDDSWCRDCEGAVTVHLSS